MIGRTVGTYQIVSRLGEGGMGEVYAAEDTALRRRVALKFLSPRIAGDAEAIARFQREAQATAALDHPNIVGIHHAGTFEGRPYIVMSLVDGEPLSNLLAAGPLPAARVADVTAQVAAALSAAHRVGVIHRDIKPDNIVVTRDGRALVLDFGLAKLADTTAITAADAAMGTAQYMAPEQIRGEPVDARADIFSLGAVVYEMLAGRPPFAGEHREALFYSILNRAPERIEVQEDPLRAALAGVAMRALEKSPADRFQTADEMLAALHPTAGGVTAPGPRAPRPWLVAALAGTVILAAALWFAFRTRGPGGETSVPSQPAGAVTTRQLTFDPRIEEWPKWSPDGRMMAYIAEVDGFRQLWMRDLGDGNSRRLTHEPQDHIQPAWSPDGSTLAFARARVHGGRLAPGDVFGFYYEGADVHVLDIESGSIHKLIDGAFNPSFSPDGLQIAFDSGWAGPRRIWVADARGRNPRQVTTDASEAVSHVEPAWSPDGTRIVYRRFEKTRSDIEIIDVRTQRTTRITNDWFLDADPSWSPDGRHVYFSSYRGGGLNIWRTPVSETGAGAPEQITTGAGDDVQPVMSPDGTKLAFSVLRLNSDVWRIPLEPDTGMPAGTPEMLIATTREDSRAAWSPDGRTIAFNSDRLGHMNLWLRSLEDGGERGLTTGPGGDYQANWAPDGRSIVFFSSRSGNADIWVADIAGGDPRPLTREPSLDINPFFAPDGTRIAFQTDRNGRSELWVMNADGSEQRRVADVEASGHFMRWFADGRRILFASGEGADRVIYSARIDDGALEQMPNISSGAHMSFSPDYTRVLEVSGHKILWIYPLDGSERRKVLEFDEPGIRIDYPMWSPDGRWAVFDRVAPQGGDIWILEGLI